MDNFTGIMQFLNNMCTNSYCRFNSIQISYTSKVIFIKHKPKVFMFLNVFLWFVLCVLLVATISNIFKN